MWAASARLSRCSFIIRTTPEPLSHIRFWKKNCRRTNPKAWVTRQFFVEWVNLVFGPDIKKYLKENNLTLQAFLILDNAPAHSPNLKDEILQEFKFINVLYLPHSTTPILQPMDQQVISNFKKLFTKHLFHCCFEVMESTNLTLQDFWKGHYNIRICLRVIDMTWQGVTKRTLTSVWKKLWLEVVPDFKNLKQQWWRRLYPSASPWARTWMTVTSLSSSRSTLRNWQWSSLRCKRRSCTWRFCRKIGASEGCGGGYLYKWRKGNVGIVGETFQLYSKETSRKSCNWACHGTI